MKKGAIIGICVGAVVAVASAITIPLVLLNKGGDEPAEPKFSAQSEVTLDKHNKQAVVSLNWTPTDHSIECSDFTFTLQNQSINSKITLGEPGSRPLKVTITFDNVLAQDDTGELDFRYEDKTIKKKGEGRIKGIEIKRHKEPEPEKKATFKLDSDSEQYGSLSADEPLYTLDISSNIGKSEFDIPFYPSVDYKGLDFDVTIGDGEKFTADYNTASNKITLTAVGDYKLADDDELIATLANTGITLTLDAGNEGYFGTKGTTQYKIKGIEEGTTLREVLASDSDYVQPTSNNEPLTPTGESTAIPYALDYYSLNGKEVRNDYVITNSVTLTAKFDLACLRFEVPEDSLYDVSSYISQTSYKTPHVAPNVKYVIDNPSGNWIDYPTEEANAFTIGKGHKVYVKGNNSDGFSFTNVATDNGTTTFKLDSVNPEPQTYSTVNAYGSIMSLIDDGACSTAVIPSHGCFNNLFKYCRTMVRAPKLPDTINEYCYLEAFSGCSKLLYAPDLLSDNLDDGCYYSMFEGCSTLEVGPFMAATTCIRTAQGTGSNNACVRMFNGCSKLRTAPEIFITAKNLSDYNTNLFEAMFRSCYSLEKVRVHFGTKNSADWPEAYQITKQWLGGDAGRDVEHPVFEWLGATEGITNDDTHVPQTHVVEGETVPFWEIHTYEE